jgi:hypothetical protein
MGRRYSDNDCVSVDADLDGEGMAVFASVLDGVRGQFVRDQDDLVALLTNDALLGQEVPNQATQPRQRGEFRRELEAF